LFPLGSYAEWSAVLQNVLANAWNAMLDSPKTVVMLRGGRGARGREWLRISDTGIGLGVPLQDSAQLFEPLERKLKIANDKRSIAIGGQGLGLTIVRMIASRRSAAAAFVAPEEGFSTTLELSWKGVAK
jgi:signal transduction histidine kinase